MPHLIFSQHGKTLLQVPLQKTNTQIGRSQACDVTLTEPSISRLQLSVYQLEGSYFVKNLGKAKLKLNGKEVESSPLKETDCLELENWQILFSNAQKTFSEEVENTYVSETGLGKTQALHLSFTGKQLQYDSLLLRIQTHGQATRNYPVLQPVTTLGKAASCDLTLDDSFASEVHAKLLNQDGKLLIYDLRSTNGTFVNGVKVGEAELEEGSVIRMGQTEIVLEYSSQTQEIKPLKVNSWGSMVGSSPAMQELYSLISQVAPVSFPVCIFGETGSGKELVAKSLHDLSSRKNSPWIALNCGAIAKELIQSELFGHEKGAFTGAHQQHKGVFEQAQGGTLFLDEVGELPLELQASLLRVLETGKLRRVGGNQEISLNVRIVCATHRDLSSLVKEGKFREDLYFRLHVLPLKVPALRDRKEDIILLAEHFLRTLLPAGRKLQFSKACLGLLLLYPWPGNIRELKNAIQRAMIFSKEETLEPSDFGFLNIGEGLNSVSKEMIVHDKLDEVEREFIRKTLESKNQNKLATAKALGIAKSTLYKKLKLYGMM